MMDAWRPEDGGSQPETAPHNIEVEQAVLGALLINNDVHDRVPFLKTEHFFDPVHARIFDKAVKLIRMGRLVSPVTIKPYLSADHGLAQLGGTDYLARLAAAVVSIGTAPDYARTIIDLWARREMVEVMTSAIQRLRTSDIEDAPDDIAGAVESGLATVRAESSPDPLIRTFDKILADAAETSEVALKGGGVPRISTGFDKLDKIIGGLQPSSHIVLAGRTSMGKSAAGIAIAQKVAREPTDDAPGRGVCFVSLEMPGQQVAQRMVSATLSERGKRIPYAQITNGRVTNEQFRDYLLACRQIERLPFVVADDNCKDLGRIRATIKRARGVMEQGGSKLELVVIDYIQIVRVDGARTTHEAVSTAAVEMKHLAKELGVPVISLCQVSRGVETRDKANRRPGLSDLRWAGELEEAADAVLMLYRPAYYLETDIKAETDSAKLGALHAALEASRNTVEIIVAKNRNGPLDTARLWADLPINRFEDAPPYEGDPEDQRAFI